MRIILIFALLMMISCIENNDSKFEKSNESENPYKPVVVWGCQMTQML